MNNIQSDIVCLTEHNLATDDPKTRYDLYKSVKRHMEGSRTIMSASSIKFPTTFKPGGTLMIVQRTVQCRINQQGSDELGRWTYIRLATRRESMIYIITIYKPCKTSFNQAGPMTVFRQQWTILRANGILSPNPRSQFDQDLLEFAQSILSEGHRIVIIGDFNETREKSTLIQELYQLGLRDAIYDRHNLIPRFRSCKKGTNVIDHCLCSMSLLQHITLSHYEPFGLNIDSDHRGMIIDFKKSTLFGRTDPIQRQGHHRLSSTNQVQSEKFLEYLVKYWQKFQLSKRMSIPHDLPKHQLRKIINGIDSDITKAFLMAEKKTRRPIRPPWSPALKTASLQVKYYKLLLEQFRTGSSHQNALQYIVTQLSPSCKIQKPQTKQECQTILRKAQKHLRKIRKHANKQRQQHLEMLVQQYIVTGENDKIRILKRIHKAEATKRCYKKLRWILRPPKPGVTFIEHKNDEGKIETIYNRQQLEQTILERNRCHFNQCAGSPFTTEPLRQLNWAADSTFAEEILKGEQMSLPIPNSTNIQAFLNLCKQRCPTKNFQISNSDLQGLFKCWRESTTTSPSGRHLGLYKIVFNPSNDDPIPTIANDIATLTNTLVQNGISLPRWRRVINMMIHKLDGSYLLNKLRVIHIFEADYNGTIGLLFNRKLLYEAEKLNALNNNQWGCRPHRQAEDALLLKELSYNLAMKTRTTLATFDNDATGCFDRVPCTVAMLASRRLGASSCMCQMQADTLQNIQHQLSTAFGLSSESYYSSHDFEIHGQGQGSRAGPPTWVFVSSLLLDCMEKLTSGVSFTCPNQQIQHQRHNDAFVDDVTGYANKFLDELQGTNVLNQVTRTMQKDAATWNELLQISGGKLALQKCLYYIISWQWTNGIATTVPPEQIQPKIHLRTDTEYSPITHLPCHQAHRTLGQMKAPVGNNEDQLLHMSKRSNSWLSAIKEASLSRMEARAAYESIWFPSISYGLGSTNLQRKQLDKLQGSVLQHILPSLGYNRHFPRAAVFGSIKLGGLHLKNLYTEQGILHILYFIKHYRHYQSIGKLLHISLRWTRLILGLSYCPLLRPSPDLHHIVDPWFRTLITFLHESHSSIETDDQPSILCRHNDSSLIEDFMNHEPTKTELRRLNLCRLYLKVTTLSDIADTNGLNILRTCWNGTSPQSSPLLWPRQERPSNSAWRIWRKYLALCYLQTDDNLRPNRLDLQLHLPLGDWTPNHHNRQHHTHYLNPINLTIYQRHQGSFKVLRPVKSTRTHLHFRHISLTNYVPISAYPVAPSYDHHQSTHVLPKQTTHNIPRHPQQPTDFEAFVETLPAWESHLLRHTVFTTSSHTASELCNLPIMIASDGSLQNNKGSYGWIISTTNGHTIAQGSGVAFGATLSSFRCEAYGILAPLRLLIRLRAYYSIPSPNNIVTWWCDSESLIKRIHSSRQALPNPNRFKLADHDLETAIVSSIPMVSQHLHPHHIRSHQYDNLPLHNLPLPYKLNRLADSLASKHNRQMTTTALRTPLITPARCQLHIHSTTITASLPNHIRQAYTHQTTITHLLRRLHTPLQLSHSIAWDEFTRAFTSFSAAHQRILRRWIYGFLPTQKRLHRYGACPSPLCPQCKHQIETDVHFLNCGGSNTWNEDLFEPLELLFHKLRATHWIQQTLTTNLRHYLDCGTPVSPNQWIQPAVDTQTQIGWHLPFYGLLSKKWIEYQNRSCPNHKNGSKLIAAINKLIFTALIRRWTRRNTTLHDPMAPHTENHQRIVNKIRALYQLKPLVLPHDQIIFSTPIETLLTRSPRTLQLFLQQNRPIIKRSIQQQKNLVQRQHRDIATYFIRQPPTSIVRHTQVTLGK